MEQAVTSPADDRSLLHWLQCHRLEVALFLTLFGTYAFFYQGGGWSQNSRLNQIRAIVESGRLEIDEYMVYRRDETYEPRIDLARRPLPAGTPLERIHRVANTGDVARASESTRHYPIKPPGSVLLTVPFYFVLHQLEVAFGANPDRWAVLTANAYLSTVFSVGLAGALTGIVFLFLSRRLFPDCSPRHHVLATLTLGLGTLMFPFSTTLFDHVHGAALLISGFACLVVVGQRRSEEPGGRWLLAVAGAAAGLSVVVNYSSLPAVVGLGLYALWVIPTRRRVGFFVLGGLPFAILLAVYHNAAFGTAFTVAQAHQSAYFLKEGLFLGTWQPFSADVLGKLLFSAHRGLFFSSPVLLLAPIGLVLMKRRGQSAEVAVIVGLFSYLLIISVCFVNWHGGWSTGPRYLTPVLPFIALPLTLVCSRFRGLFLALAGLSAAFMLFATAVDVQPSDEILNPWRDYLLPLFMGNTIHVDNTPIVGPVSANPIGVYESRFYVVFAPGTPQVRWNSFNLGEFLWHDSAASLIPVLAWLAAGISCLWRWTNNRVALASDGADFASPVSPGPSGRREQAADSSSLDERITTP